MATHVRWSIIALLVFVSGAWEPFPTAEAADVTPAPRLPAVTGKDAQSHVWTAYTDRQAFLKSCGIDSVKDIHVLVVARDGAILAMETGRHSEDAAARILAVLGG
jgi:hypothetical protein